MVSLCSPGCPGTHSVDHAGLELRNPPVSASQSVGITGVHHPSLAKAGFWYCHFYDPSLGFSLAYFVLSHLFKTWMLFPWWQPKRCSGTVLLLIANNIYLTTNSWVRNYWGWPGEDRDKRDKGRCRSIKRYWWRQKIGKRAVNRHLEARR